MINLELEVIAEKLFGKNKKIIYDRNTNEPYLIRYYILFKDRPKWFPFNIVLHHILKSDNPDCGLHDHPWKWSTFILKGGYYEDTLKGSFWRPKWSFRTGSSTDFHRLKLDHEKSKGEEIWTLFLMGPKEKEWGFLNDDNNWVDHKTYLEYRLKA